MQIQSAINSFLQDCKAANLSGGTCQRYQDDLDEFAAYLAHRDIGELEKVSTDVLREFVTHLLTRPSRGRGRENGSRALSPHTVDGRYRSVHRFFSFCMAEGWLGENPMARVRKPRLTKCLVQRLDDQQVEEVLQLIEHTKNKERNMALVLLMVYSGLRRGEVLGLKIPDVDLDEGSVVVLGKGRKMRRVPINAATSHALGDWLAIRPNAVGDFVFVNRDGTAFAKDGVQSLFTRMRTQLGLRRFHPHLLRHTFAAIYLKRVRDYKSLQKILGHARASTTLDIYADFEDFQTIKKLHTEAMGDKGRQG